ncbi:MAG: heme ABC transporter ATP-binding protein CcmA [Gammaproteobacteria bacterium]|nr:MAG: heme ABC transporter ATP-binding protein CcmA [Gammaproteobacteria bacterium]RLA12804.1 MAG: heme ABC transporter ATP-binding protein CcmA [Gammaproteobacteria bacterium]RLA18196.1 MAG: heme ABC transporter ATP-binding protein CcmA [Gammaproteobacteria bacterium]
MISTKNLAALRGERLLFRGVTFSLGPGEAMRITGANGSGKTTLLRILAGLSEPEQGQVSWGSQNIRDCREEYYRHLAYSGHQFGLRGDLTALENLRYLLPRTTTDAALVETMQQVGLERCVDLPARYLSQGQRRRLILARLLAAEASCWILDEPLAALDTAGIKMVESLCAEHLQNAGILIITSHQNLSSALGGIAELRLG